MFTNKVYVKLEWFEFRISCIRYNGIEIVFVISCYIIASCLWPENNFEIKKENLL